uniref:Uncharacterized protein n=1 Tax=Globisporangium ultimum (strain ATCC 200006 / CBS 805.95 / DAOM BR144) TaxID=431595 RepID=K3WEF5_GLOUD
MSNSMEPGATMADAPAPVQDALSVVAVDAPPAQPQQEEPQVDELQVASAAVGDANEPEDPNDTEDEGMGDDGDDGDDDEPIKSHDNMQSQYAQMEVASEPLDHAGTDAAGTSGGAAEDERADDGGEDAGAEQVQSNADDPQDAPMEIADDSAPTDCAITGAVGSSAAATECEGAGEDTSVEQTQPNVDEQSAAQAVDETSEPQTAVTSEGDENMHEAVENARTGHGDDEHLHDAQDGDNHHDTDEYDPADPGYDRASDMYERHGSDEYDPANPSSTNDENAYDAAHAGDHEDGEYDPANPGGSHHDDDEYDPANPSYDQNAYDPSHPSSYESSSHQMPQTQSPPESGVLDAPDATLKRKSSAPPAESGAANTHDVQQQPLQLADQRASKRQRSRSSESTRSLDRKPDNIEPRRKEEDKKGLSDAAWDRLKDFQSGSSDFEMTQVSRAAFASVSSLPEFAQVSIVARFTRVPMKDIRDKNGQLMRIYHEYLKENPHIPLLQPVSVYIADYKTDPGLFEYGYAPPFPVHGISSTPVPKKTQ